MIFSESIDQIAPALVAAIAELKNVGREKEGQIGSSKYKYADLAQIIEAAKPVLEKHGLTVMQPMTGGDDGYIKVETVLIHTSGQHMTSSASLPMPDGSGRGTISQQVGSAVSYLRRYALAASLSIAQADEDEQGRALARARGRSAKDEHQVEDQIERRRIHRSISDAARQCWGDSASTELPGYVASFSVRNGCPKDSSAMSLEQLGQLLCELRDMADERPESENEPPVTP